MASSRGKNKASGILEQTEQHAREVLSLKEKLKSTEEMLLRAEEQIKNARSAKYTVPKGRRAKSSKTDYVRFIIPDVHGCHMDDKAVSAMLGDLEALQPKEVVIMGDFLSCDGFLAQHFTLAYVTQSKYTYQEDCDAGNKLLDQIQMAAPGASYHYIEGNHEARIEKYCITAAQRSGAPDVSREAEHIRLLYGTEYVLELKKRNIPLYRQGKFYHNLGIPATIKLGKCHFTHGITTSMNAAKVHVERFGGNVVFGHTHRADSYHIRTVGAGVIGAWSPGCLCELQPLYMHQTVSNWSHGYGLQLVKSSGDFLHINVPIRDGKSHFVGITEKLR